MAEENSPKDQIGQIVERLDFLEHALREQIGRLYAIEQHLGLAPQSTKSEPLEPAVEARVGVKPPEPQPPPPEVSRPREPVATPPPPRLTSPPPISEPRAQTRARDARADLEARIGGSWFNRIGIIAIILGVGFFLKYAFENQWIGPRGRVIIGIVIGLAFLIVGEGMRTRGYRHYAQGLSGGGIGILYLSIFAAFSFYQLLGQLPAFFLMTLVTITAVLLAARYDALPIAVLGLIGGFLTPILLSTGVDNEAALFSYITLLDLGVLALAYFKQWRSLNYLAFFATVSMVAVWMDDWYAPGKLWMTVFFLTDFFLIFALLAVLHQVINRRPAKGADIALILINAALYFGTSYWLLEASYHPYLGLFAVLMSAFYLGLGYLTYIRDREDRYLILSFLGLAAVFLTLAVPIQLDQNWVTMGWALEGVALTWVGLRAGSRATRSAALLIFVTAALHWLSVDVSDFAYQAGQAFTPLINRRAASGGVLIASLAAAAWLFHRLRGQVEEEERAMFGGVYVLGANVLAITLLSLDVNDYFERAKAALLPDDLVGRVGRESGRIENAKQFSLSVLWILYGAAALIIGVTRRLRLLRFGALILLGLATFKVLVADASYYAAPWHTPIFNQTFAAFALLIAALACSAWFYARTPEIGGTERAFVLPALTAAANLFAIIALSLEASGYFEAEIRSGGVASDKLRNLQLAKQLSLSVIWAVYGGALLVAGIWRRSLLLRVMALLLLGITILKVFLVDLAFLDTIYRIISFIVLGAILLAVSFLYQQWQRRAAEAEGKW